MILKNVTDGPKGVNSLAGPVVIGPDQQAEVELSEAEEVSALGTGWFAKVEQDAPAKPAKSKPATKD